MSDRLYEDVHTGEVMAQYARDLAVRDEDDDDAPERPPLKAVERGRRYRPDGTVEEYERAEFDTDD